MTAVCVNSGPRGAARFHSHRRFGDKNALRRPWVSLVKPRNNHVTVEVVEVSVRRVEARKFEKGREADATLRRSSCCITGAGNPPKCPRAAFPYLGRLGPAPVCGAFSFRQGRQNSAADYDRLRLAPIWTVALNCVRHLCGSPAPVAFQTSPGLRVAPPRPGFLLACGSITGTVGLAAGTALTQQALACDWNKQANNTSAIVAAGSGDGEGTSQHAEASFWRSRYCEFGFAR
jgi:hypothetical protein